MKKEPKLKDGDVLNLVKTLEYLNYLKYEKNQRVAFEINGRFYMSDKLNDILGNIDVEEWRKIITKISKIVDNDNEFNDFLEWRHESCEKCRTVVKKEKCSKYHPEWKNYNCADGKYNYDNEDRNPPNEVKLCICPNCGHISSESCSIDKNPEEGLTGEEYVKNTTN